MELVELSNEDVVHILSIIKVDPSESNIALAKESLEVWCRSTNFSDSNSLRRKVPPGTSKTFAEKLYAALTDIIDHPETARNAREISLDHRGAAAYLRCRGVKDRDFELHTDRLKKRADTLRRYIRYKFINKRGPKSRSLTQDRSSKFRRMKYLLEEIGGKATLSRVGDEATGTMPEVIRFLRSKKYLQSDIFDDLTYRTFQDLSEWNYLKLSLMPPVPRTK